MLTNINRKQKAGACIASFYVNLARFLPEPHRLATLHVPCYRRSIASLYPQVIKIDRHGQDDILSATQQHEPTGRGKEIMPNPLSEVFGFPTDNRSEDAVNHVDNELCPFHNIVPKCTKDSKIRPLGVCSILDGNQPVITCPVRLRENWYITTDAANFFFPGNKNVFPLPEVRLKDKYKKSVGKIDFVIVAYDQYGRVLDFAPLEVQSVYISGNIRGPFEYFKDKRGLNIEWPRNQDYPKPDWLSSSMKRLVPQIVAKGSIMRQWGKKQAVAVQKSFFDRIPKAIPQVPKEQADMIWLLYDLVHDPATNRRKLTRLEPVYSSFEQTLMSFTAYEAGSEDDFKQVLQDRLNKAVQGKLPEDGDDIVVNGLH